MLPTNVMSFMKKMVTAQPETTAESVTPEDTGTTFSKLRQLMTVTGNVAKGSPAKVTPVEDLVPKEEAPVIEPIKPKPEPGRPASRAGSCRVCLKAFKPDDFSRTCYECQFKVCDDCASYSETKDYDDPSTWRCSVCRRKIASRGQPIVTQESTDSLLEVPVLEALQRRHSDARLSCQSGGPTSNLGSGLAPPRSPELRRHSDVSPASLKELEKVAGERREELRWERELEWRSKSRSGSPDRHSNDRGRPTSPSRTAKTPSIEQEGDIGEDEDERRRRAARRSGGTIRRKSRVTRQHSYDDEIKPGGTLGSGGAGGGGGGGGGGGQTSHNEPGLGLPVQLPRRASAYDVYATPGSGGLNAMAIAAAQQRASISAQGAREPEERPLGRRQSFRVVKPVMPYEMSNDDEKIINLDSTSAPDSQVLQPDEQSRPMRRRASMLPDINMIRSLPSVPGSVKGTPASVARVAAQDDRELPRQGSLADGEGIKIVIHDVDSDLAPRMNTKRRIVLRRDPLLMDKGHRSRGFGMRVVGGKNGTDGRLYASIVWTVPGGPADKAGLQKGDKVLEWSGVSLIDRNFEDVAQIIERCSDVAELVVEHVGDMGIDSLDEPGMPPPSSKTSGNLGLQLDSETDKSPSSPTRRKLPKTPEQLAKERQVSGRVQIHVWYEADRKELVVSVLAADELCVRDDGSPPEAFAKLVLMPTCGDQSSLQTDVTGPTQNPIWNANLTFTGIAGEKLMDKTIDVTLWDCHPDGDNIFLGECSIDLQNAFETDRESWYRLEDPRGIRSGKSPYASPRGSLSMEIAQRLLRRELRERSYSEDTQSDSGSPEPYFLHPDHAWQANSRRGSSQSEQLEVEPYELSKDYSRSLPGSRRSSFQSQGGTDSKRGSIVDTEMPSVYYNRDRRRSSVARSVRDPEEVLRSLKKAAAKGELGRTMSLSSDKRRGSRRDERKDSMGGRGEKRDSIGQTMMAFSERFYDRNSESDEDDKWSQLRDENGVDVKLGPGQVAPRGFKLIGGIHSGEVKLALFLSKGTLEVEVICARDICPGEKEEPDTYVKTYLRDGERWIHKRKTRVIRHSRNPQYRQTLKYGSCDALGRNLLVMLWEKKQGFESNQGLGGAEVDLELLPLTTLTVGWYPIFPIHTLGTQNDNSP
ncbi:regulating synaptic membrane exocytosis protein 1 isoform X2 [Microplitis demolitor]|uniref:regulating synaptic membrane exocytosis protein 1 isoform X2 n=1 Tax=Microplitis demolitor TaxID=69319 RepID=UPI0004CD9C7A|nr:regulating synaptic membrane exocytosis protein 1 isoform X2 [Microplitis demolitor]